MGNRHDRGVFLENNALELTPVDAETLEQLVRDHAAALELFASQWTSSPQDCVQDAFLQLLRQKTPPQRVIPWLFRVVRNRALSLARENQRRRNRERRVAQQKIGAVSDSLFSPNSENVLDGEQVTQALRRLPDPIREVVTARIWGGLSFEEIGEVIGAGSSTAHRRYETGLTMLRNELGLKWLTNKTPAAK